MFKFLKDENGQAMVEYGLIIAFVSVAAVSTLLVLGPQLAKLFTDTTAILSAT